MIASNEPDRISNPSRGMVCHISTVMGATGDDDATALANARLIAAAPTMAEALEEAAKTFRHYGDLHAAKPDPMKAQRNYEMADKMLAALQLAKGDPRD